MALKCYEINPKKQCFYKLRLKVGTGLCSVLLAKFVETNSSVLIVRSCLSLNQTAKTCEDRFDVTKCIIILRLLGRRAVPYCKLTLLNWSTNSLLLKIR